MSRTKIVSHCWTGNTEFFEWGSDEWAEAFLCPATCMLMHGHEGRHEFIPDSEIKVTFEPRTVNMPLTKYAPSTEDVGP